LIILILYRYFGTIQDDQISTKLTYHPDICHFRLFRR